MIKINYINITNYLLLFGLCLPLVGFGQKNNAVKKEGFCASTTKIHEERMKVDPTYSKHVNKWKTVLKNKTFQRSPNCANGPTIIPVAIHFEAGLVPAGSEACAIDLVVDQINVLNEKMNGNDPDNGVYANFQSCLPPIGSACVEFCISTENHPTGYGINNGDLAITFGEVDFSIINPGSYTIPIDTNWTGYLNIFVGFLEGGIRGEASGIPGDINSGSGVSLRACNFGSGNISCSGFNNTNTCGGVIYSHGDLLLHEVGHYFGLYHISGDFGWPGCNIDDSINDTPNMGSIYDQYLGCGSHSSCNDLPITCGSPDMYMNYMAYTADQCMYMFSSEQANVMSAAAAFMGFDTNTPTICQEPFIQAKVFLEGFFNGTNGLTKDTNHSTLIPNNQPFNTAPWNYNGNETVANIPANAVDWILFVARDVNGNIQEQKPGFISTTGEIMDTDGTIGISVSNASTYFSIHHKSHLAVMSSSPYTSGTYDFTNNVNQAQGIDQMVLQNGQYMMYSGDYDCNGIINNIDFNNWKTNGATLNQYLNVDGDGNGIINNLDYNLWTKNRSKIGHPPLQY